MVVRRGLPWLVSLAGATVSFAACVGDAPELAAVAEDAGAVDGAREAGAGDGGDVDAEPAPPAPICDRTKPFQIIEEVTELNSPASVGNFTARLTDDGLQVFFTRALTGTDLRLFRAKRVSRSKPFDPPAEVEGLGHVDTEFDSYPFPFADGAALYFQRSTGGGVDRDILYAAAVGTSFTKPVSVLGLSSEALKERAGYLATDKAMWFDLNQADGGPQRRIATATHVRADAFNPYTVVDLGTPENEDDQEPVISSDRLTLFFASKRGGRLTWDTFVARRDNETTPWKSAEELAVINTPQDDEPSWISPDDCELYFHRIIGIAYHIFRVRRPL